MPCGTYQSHRFVSRSHPRITPTKLIFQSIFKTKSLIVSVELYWIAFHFKVMVGIFSVATDRRTMNYSTQVPM